VIRPYRLATMKPLFNARTKRNTAVVVLLVWLFALASGVANACLIQAREIDGDRFLAAHSSAAGKLSAISAVHGDAIPQLISALEASKSQCLKVCDDGSQSLPKQQAGYHLIYPDLAPLLTLAWTTATPVVCALGLAVFKPPSDRGLPIRVRLSRLAL